MATELKKKYWSSGICSITCVLFALIRYTSILVLIISMYSTLPVYDDASQTTTGNYGFFWTHFTPESCQRFFWAVPIMKGIVSLSDSSEKA